MSANTLLRVVSIFYCPIPCDLEAAPSQFESTNGSVLKVDVGLNFADPVLKEVRDGLLAMCIVTDKVMGFTPHLTDMCCHSFGP